MPLFFVKICSRPTPSTPVFMKSIAKLASLCNNLYLKFLISKKISLDTPKWLKVAFSKPGMFKNIIVFMINLVWKPTILKEDPKRFSLLIGLLHKGVSFFSSSPAGFFLKKLRSFSPKGPCHRKTGLKVFQFLKFWAGTFSAEAFIKTHIALYSSAHLNSRSIDLIFS